jgi:hypothetical protein
MALQLVSSGKGKNSFKRTGCSAINLESEDHEWNLVGRRRIFIVHDDPAAYQTDEQPREYFATIPCPSNGSWKLGSRINYYDMTQTLDYSILGLYPQFTREWDCGPFECPCVDSSDAAAFHILVREDQVAMVDIKVATKKNALATEPASIVLVPPTGEGKRLIAGLSFSFRGPSFHIESQDRFRALGDPQGHEMRKKLESDMKRFELEI